MKKNITNQEYHEEVLEKKSVGPSEHRELYGAMHSRKPCSIWQKNLLKFCEFCHAHSAIIH